MSPNETSASLLQLCGRKHKSKMGANLNESVATGPSDFARKQLEKLGWTEGTGLGKNRDGRAEHIRVTKRKDELALGASAAAIELDPVVTGDQWWKSSVGNTLARLAEKNKKKKKSKKKSSKRKSRGSDGSSDSDDGGEKGKKKKSKKTKKRKLEYTDEELFAATGGARFGMRAQTQQKGKWNRAEEKISEEEEKEAKAKTEWDGMAAPKVILTKSFSAKTPTTKDEEAESCTHDISESETNDDKGTDEKPPKKKMRKSSEGDEGKEKKSSKKEKKRKKKEEKKKK